MVKDYTVLLQGNFPLSRKIVRFKALHVHRIPTVSLSNDNNFVGTINGYIKYAHPVPRFPILFPIRARHRL